MINDDVRILLPSTNTWIQLQNISVGLSTHVYDFYLFAYRFSEVIGVVQICLFGMLAYLFKDKHFGNLLVTDTYFGVATYVQPVLAMGIDIISCLKSNVCLFYVPKPQTGKRKRGRPATKDGKIDWKNLDNERLPIVEQDAEKIVRSALVYVKCLKTTVSLVAVDYLKEDGTLQTRKLYFSNRIDWDFKFIMKHYQCRYQIEFLFRDAKQFAGLMHCQSTDETKLVNHLNVSLTTVSVAKATHWQQNEPFSMNDIKNYYHNLKMVELFSDALGLEPNSVKNNPKIIQLLFSMNYEEMAA